MTLGAVLYLLQIYWPFLAIALVIGVATGWYSSQAEHQREGSQD